MELMVFQCASPCRYLIRSDDRREIIIAVSAHMKRAHHAHPSMREIRERLYAADALRPPARPA